MMVKIVEYKDFPVISVPELEEFEQQNHLVFPADYREFLIKYNGGRPIPSSFWIDPPKEGSGVFRFYGLHHGHLPPSLETYCGEDRYGVPQNLLPIGDDGVGDLICIGITPANLGKVYFWNHELRSVDDPESLLGITILAGSFTEFLDSLVKSESGEDDEEEPGE